jgi:MraZ protein
MLRGNALAKIDEKGRLKVPSVYRALLEPTFGAEFFVTSLSGDSVQIYPMQVWSELERRLGSSSLVEPRVRRLRYAFNYYGQGAALDAQGRLLIHPLLRESAEVRGEVAVLGQQNFLEVWNRSRLEERLRQEPLTDDDLKELAALGF